MYTPKYKIEQEFVSTTAIYGRYTIINIEQTRDHNPYYIINNAMKRINGSISHTLTAIECVEFDKPRNDLELVKPQLEWALKSNSDISDDIFRLAARINRNQEYNVYLHFNSKQEIVYSITFIDDNADANTFIGDFTDLVSAQTAAQQHFEENYNG